MPIDIIAAIIEVLNPIIVVFRVVLCGARRSALFQEGFAVSCKEFRSRKSVATFWKCPCTHQRGFAVRCPGAVPSKGWSQLTNVSLQAPQPTAGPHRSAHVPRGTRD